MNALRKVIEDLKAEREALEDHLGKFQFWRGKLILDGDDCSDAHVSMLKMMIKERSKTISALDAILAEQSLDV